MLVGTEVFVMKHIIFYTFMLFSFCSNALTNNEVVGTWTYSEVGQDYKDTKICTFSNNGDLNCLVEEQGITEHGFGEAHTFKTNGTWSISNDELTLSETILDDLLITKFQIISINSSKLVLISSNKEQVWQQSLNAIQAN